MICENIRQEWTDEGAQSFHDCQRKAVCLIHFPGLIKDSSRGDKWFSICAACLWQETAPMVNVKIAPLSGGRPILFSLPV